MSWPTRTWTQDGWQDFRLNTIDKLTKGVQEPNKKVFDALYNWMYTVNKGPDLETISET